MFMITNNNKLLLIETHEALSVRSKDVRLPVQLQRVMAAEAEAAREARAKVGPPCHHYLEKDKDDICLCIYISPCPR